MQRRREVLSSAGLVAPLVVAFFVLVSGLPGCDREGDGARESTPSVAKSEQRIDFGAAPRLVTW